MEKLKLMLGAQMLAMALRFAAWDWLVFPLHEPLPEGGCSCGNPKCGSVGKHPRTPNGFKDASKNPDTVRWWWRRWPNANIGIATGQESNLVVLDLDIREKGGSTVNGVAEFERMRERWPGLPFEPMVETANGGHLYYAWPGRLVRCTQGVVAPGIDVRGDGGYVVGAGSLHESGERYEFLDDLFEGELPVFPPELQELNEGSRRAPGAVAAAAGAIIPDGTRNTALFKLACRYRGQGMSGEALEAKLVEENATRCDPPMDEEYVRKLSRRVEATYAPNLEFTDVENGRLFAAQHAGRAIYARGQSGQIRGGNNWYAYDGRRWVLSGDDTLNLAKATTDTLREVAREEPDEARRRSILRKIGLARSAPRIRAMLDMAQSEPEISRSGADLDSDGWLLNCLNGTINLRTGALRPHDSDDLITRIAGVNFEPDRSCPRWEKFLGLVLDDDVELKKFMQKAIGASLVGGSFRRQVFCLCGPGNNGKTTLLSTLLGVLGEYGATAHTSLLMKRRAEDETELNPGLFNLRGRRLAVLSESDHRGYLGEAKLKQITGGGRVSVRGLYRDPIEFAPAFTIWLDTNELPSVANTIRAMKDRIVVIPFTVDVEARLREMDRNPKQDFAAELLKEGPGILAWAVEGCRLWDADGQRLVKPPVVNRATSTYWKEQDRIAQFAAECLVDEPTAREINPQTMYETYVIWSRLQGERSLNSANFKKKMEEKGYRQVTIKGKKSWADIGFSEQGGLVRYQHDYQLRSPILK